MGWVACAPRVPPRAPDLAPPFPGFSARIAGKVFLGHTRGTVRAEPGIGQARSLAYVIAYVRQAKQTGCCRARGGAGLLTPAGSVEPRGGGLLSLRHARGGAGLLTLAGSVELFDGLLPFRRVGG